jgi:hypothetical protein
VARLTSFFRGIAPGAASHETPRCHGIARESLAGGTYSNTNANTWAFDFRQGGSKRYLVSVSKAERSTARLRELSSMVKSEGDPSSAIVKLIRTQEGPG